MWKKIDISKVLIQCNKDSCYEHITVGVNIYLYRCVFLLGTECAVCLWVWVYLYVCVCVRSNHTTSKKPHYLSELSKLIKCTHPPPTPISTRGWGVALASNQIFKRGAGLDRISIFRGGCWKRGGNFFRGWKGRGGS